MYVEACTNYFLKSNLYQTFNRLVLKFGIWLEGKIYWLDQLQSDFFYKNQIKMDIQQDTTIKDALITNFSLENLSSQNYNLKVICQYRDLPANEYTSFIAPNQNLIYKCINDDLYLINGKFDNAKVFCTVTPTMDRFCEMTGSYSYYPMSSSRSLGIQVFELKLFPNEIISGSSWVISGQNDENLLYLNQSLIKTD